MPAGVAAMTVVDRDPPCAECRRLAREHHKVWSALQAAVAWLTTTEAGRAVPEVDGQPGRWLAQACRALELPPEAPEPQARPVKG